MKSLLAQLSLLVLSLSCPLFGQPAVAPSEKIAAATTRPVTDLLTGATWQYRLNPTDEWSSQPPPFQRKLAFQARCNFERPGSADWAGANLHLALPDLSVAGLKIGDKDVELPIRSMWYKHVVIPGSSIQAGTNQLLLSLWVEIHNANSNALSEGTFLAPLCLADLTFVTRPVLGAAGEDYFTVSCETNLNATASVHRAGDAAVLASSPQGTAHRMKVPCDKTRGEFVLVVTNGHATLKTPLSLLPAPTAERMTFVSIGDTQGGGAIYATLAEAALKHRPHMLVRTGDIVQVALKRWLWDEDLLHVGGASLTSVPHYWVPGNHDLVRWFPQRVVYTPTQSGMDYTWSQRVGPALMIGINAFEGFDTDSKNIQWLDDVLKQAKDAKFVFLFSHVAPISSGRHTIRRDGKIVDKWVREASEVIMPLLAKHKVAAYVCGHDHGYERLEPEGGITVIVAAGGGGTLRGKTWEPAASKVFVAKQHYCLFEIDGDTCTMRALTVEGKELDKKVWQARTTIKP